MKIAEAKAKKVGDVTVQMLKTLSVFSWLLSDEQRKEVQTLVKSAVGNGVAASAVGSSSSSSSGAAPRAAMQGTKRAEKPSVKEEEDATMMLFRKRAKK